MVITKESVEARILQLQQDMANADASYHACEGAIADCRFWLKQVETEEVNAVPPKEVKKKKGEENILSLKG